MYFYVLLMERSWIVQTGCWSPSASYPMGAKGSLPECKVAKG